MHSINDQDVCLGARLSTIHAVAEPVPDCHTVFISGGCLTLNRCHKWQVSVLQDTVWHWQPLNPPCSVAVRGL